MTQIIKQTLRDSAGARWAALLIVSFTMMWGYFLTNAMSPLFDSLGGAPNFWKAEEYGTYYFAYGWLNVFLFMLIFGGLILDKIGVRLTGIISVLCMIVGAFIQYYAVQYISPADAGSILGLRMQVAVAAAGYSIFAMGSEMTGVTISRVIVKWFNGKELSLAMGIQVAIARIGTALALGLGNPIVRAWGLSAPLLLALILLVIGFFAYITYCVMDTKLDKQVKFDVNKDEEFKFSDIKNVISNKGFWLIALLCVLFYSAVFPFYNWSTSLFVSKYHIDKEIAGWVSSMVALGNIALTPLFGYIYGKKGKGATLMIVGAALLILVHLLLAMPALNYWWFAAFVMIILGVAFSLVPSAMWPSVPKIIPEKQLGTAFALIFWVQNVGLAFVPKLIGWVLDKYCVIEKIVSSEGKEELIYNYVPMELIFAVFGVVAIIFALWLKREDRHKKYGLEELKK